MIKFSKKECNKERTDLIKCNEGRNRIANKQGQDEKNMKKKKKISPNFKIKAKKTMNSLANIPFFRDQCSERRFLHEDIR